jgi:MFS family permease
VSVRRPLTRRRPTAPTADRPRSAARTAAVGGLLAALVLASSVPTALWPAYQARLGYWVGTTIVLFACYVLALLPATLIAGPVADVAGARPVVAVSVVVAAAATVPLAAAPSVARLAAGRLTQGVAVGAAGASLTAALLAVEPRGNHRQASLLATALRTAAAGAGPVVSGVLAGGGDIVAPYATAVVLLALAAGAALPVLPGPPPREAPLRLWRRPALPGQPGARQRFAAAARCSLLVWAISYADLAVTPSFAVAGAAPPRSPRCRSARGGAVAGLRRRVGARGADQHRHGDPPRTAGRGGWPGRTGGGPGATVPAAAPGCPGAARHRPRAGVHGRPARSDCPGPARHRRRGLLAVLRRHLPRGNPSSARHRRPERPHRAGRRAPGILRGGRGGRAHARLPRRAPAAPRQRPQRPASPRADQGAGTSLRSASHP